MFNGPSGAEVDLTQPEVVLLPHHCLRVTIGKVTQEQSTCVHASPSDPATTPTQTQEVSWTWRDPDTNRLYNFTLIQENRNWTQARNYCSSRGDRLVQPDSELKNRFLKEKLQSLNLEGVWIGAMKNLNDGKWYYSDGSLVSFTNWASGEPNNHHRNESCVGLWNKWNHNFDWNDTPCDWGLNVVCERTLQQECARSLEFSINSRDFTDISGVWGLLKYTELNGVQLPVYARNNICWWPTYTYIYSTRDCFNSSQISSIGEYFAYLPLSHNTLCFSYGVTVELVQLRRLVEDMLLQGYTNISSAKAPCPECKTIEEGPLNGTYILKNVYDWECGADTDRCCYVMDGEEYCFQEEGLYSVDFQCPSTTTPTTTSTTTNKYKSCKNGTVPCGYECIPENLSEYFYACGDNCTYYDQPCNGTCPENSFFCGDQCRNDRDSEYYYTCGDECLRTYKQCNGICPKNSFICGDQCRNDRDSESYYTCGGKCLSIYQQCYGTCPKNTTICGDQCLDEKRSEYYYACGDECLRTNQQCNGTCPENTFICGDRCMDERDSEYYYTCGGKCLSITQQCNGICPENTTICDYRCLTEYDRGSYYICGDRCSHFSDLCNGTCPDDRILCNGQCISEDNRDWTYMCGDECLMKNEQCNGTCPENQTICGDQCVHERKSVHYYTCGDECLITNQQCNGTCPENTFICGDQCRNDRDSENYYTCGDKCLRTSQQCNGTCPKYKTICGNHCINEGNSCNEGI